MDVRMIAMDLDETLLRKDRNVSDFSLGILRRCQEKGIKIVIATARAEKVAQRLTDRIKADAVIASAGARTVAAGKAVAARQIPADATDAIIHQIVHAPSYVNLAVDTDAGYYVSWKKDGNPDIAHAIEHDFTMPIGHGAYKIQPTLKDPQDAARIAAQFPAYQMATFAGVPVYRFAHRDACKMQGVRDAAQHFGIEISQVAAFGDDYPDMEMIRDCGVGVAMGNAVDEVKAVADWVCASHEEDGVARWIEEHIL